MTTAADLRAHARIDHGAITANLATVTAHLPAGTSAMVVVKADAYGHGMVPVARTARAAGATWLGVALPSEALTLRAAGDGGRILAWLFPPGDPALVECLRTGVDLSAATIGTLDELAAIGEAVGRVPQVQLKVDTGLGRGGCLAESWPDLIAHAAGLERAGRLTVTGLWSHLSCADEPDRPETSAQAEVFDLAVGQAHRAGLDPEVRHLANSAAALTRSDLGFDLVRIGIAAYGLTPGAALGTAAGLGLRPAMTLVARVALTKTLPTGHAVSYGASWTAPAPTRVALIPVGYADGLPRRSAGEVSIGGRRCPVLGRVAMDQCVVAVGDTGVVPGQEVIVFGDAAAGEPTADDWGSWSATIGYEIVTRIGPRVPRVHAADGSGLNPAGADR